MSDTNREQAERGSLILNRLVPAPDHGRGFRRDPQTGFVYYSSEWLGDEPPRPVDAAKRIKREGFLRASRPKPSE